jgi:hypothetical protein
MRRPGFVGLRPAGDDRRTDFGWRRERPMNGTVLHFAFAAIAWLAAGLSLFWLVRTAKVRFPSSPAGGGAMLIRQAFR